MWYTLTLISATATAASSMLSAKPVNMEIYQNVGLDCIMHTLQETPAPNSTNIKENQTKKLLVCLVHNK